MVSESTTRRLAGLVVIVGSFVLLYALAAGNDLTPAFVASTLPLFGLGAALVVGGGLVRRYVHHLHGSTE
ncbi:hypothetical protein [Halorubellus salinus]|uniref:hypothetical protein n=1 Tax=Halorubellus salinus TaxID=755309 RepID=UPI001D0709B1|nr:hypothetical protein [Halorubellus salinus]